MTAKRDPQHGPVPEYPDEEVRALAMRIEDARARRRTLSQAGMDVAAIDREILQLRRALREGGRLRAGDSLSDDRYLLLHELGRGGFATVWRALDHKSNEHVAIKVLHTNLAGDKLRRERFFRGARIMAQLDHPAITRVLEGHGEDGGFHYFVMEYVEGGDLRHALQGHKFGLGELIDLFATIASALSLAHARGFIHRDVKPTNILMAGGARPKLTDFDLVAANDSTGGTRTGALGTFLYSAPEMMERPQDAGPRVDVYSLGMTFLFALHGKELPLGILRNPDSLIRDLACPDALKHLLRRAVEWDPERRISSMDELRAELMAVRLEMHASVGEPLHSPFKLWGGVNDPKLFFGRTHETSLISSGAFRNYLVVGARQIGKTSILKHILRQHHQRVIFITLTGPDLEADLHRAGQPPLDELIQTAKGKIIAFDEADQFIAADRKLGYPVCRRLRAPAEEGLCRFILAGFWELHRAAALEHLSPLGNLADRIQVGPLDRDAARSLAMIPLRQINVEFASDVLVSELLDRTGCRPNLIALACDAAVAQLGQSRGRVIDADLLRAVLNVADKTGERVVRGIADVSTLSDLRHERILDRMVMMATVQFDQFSQLDVLAKFKEVGAVVSIEELQMSFERLKLAYVLERRSGAFTYPVPLLREYLFDQADGDPMAILADQLTQDWSRRHAAVESV